MFQIQNLNLAFGEKVIFKEAKLSINIGDKVGLIGLNGHGKSTLLKVITGEVIPDDSSPPFIFDTNNQTFEAKYIPQELDVSRFSDLKVEQYYLSLYPELRSLHEQMNDVTSQLADHSDESLLKKQQQILDQIEHLQGWEIEQSFLNYLNTFDMLERGKEMSSLSGGEQRKVALAMGLSAKANLILWDEPTNHLDAQTIEKFEDELKKSSKTMMIISHDRYLLTEITNRIIHIERGNIHSFKGHYLEYLEYQKEYAKELAKNLDKLENKHRRELEWMRQGIKARGTRSKKRVEQFHNIEKDIQKIKDRHRKQIQMELQHSGKKSKLLFEIKGAEFSYPGQPALFSDVNLDLYRGDKVALLGPNGAGKTTLIKIIQGLLSLSSGEIKSPKDFNVIAFDQKRQTLDLEKTLFEIVGDGQDFVHFNNGRSEHVISYLQNFLFDKSQIHRPVSTLSGGEKNRLQLAMFMSKQADMWIFDEPTNDLDIETIEKLEELLIDYQQAVIIISHDRSFLDKVCQKSWLVDEHKVLSFQGGYTQVANYLFEKEMIEEVLKSQPPKTQKTNEASRSLPKMSYNEKKRWKVIENEIEEIEAQLNEIEQKMAGFDFTQENFKELYSQLEKEHQTTKKKQEQLYLEFENLSEKEP